MTARPDIAVAAGSTDLQTVADITANADLVVREREARDRGWWQQMRECYYPNSEVNVSWFHGGAADFVKESEQMAARGDRTRHRLAPPTVHVNGERAVVTVGTAIESLAAVHGVEADLVAYCRLLYRTERRQGRWRIVGLHCVYERDTLTPALPGQQVPVDTSRLASLRPSYRLMAYVFGERGYTIDQQQPGDDRPEQVAALYRDAFTWAGLRQP
jgi:SnoaL-like protein